MPSSDPRYLLILTAAALLLPVCPRGRWRLGLLTVIGYAFYLALCPGCGPFLLAVSAVAYLSGLQLARMADGGVRTAVFAASLLCGVAPLVAFKAGASFAGVSLPIGLSFYTFQALGYIIDTFVRSVAPERDPVRFAAFMSFFPQLAAGPIARARQLLPQLDLAGQFDYTRAVAGLRVLLAGLFMKIVIADTLAPIVESVYASPSAFSATDLALATTYFSFQVYADFAGYSLIAIGSARLLGIELVENFAQPFLSQSLPEFWRRWHISLSSWFRDYVFTPLQFQWRRRGALGLLAALIVTFTLIGVWHGTGVQYVVFGLAHGVLVGAATLTARRRERWRRQFGVPAGAAMVSRVAITFAIVTLTFVLFRAGDARQALVIYDRLLSVSWGVATLPLLWPGVLIALVVCGDLFARWPVVVGQVPPMLRWTIYHAATVAVIGTVVVRFLSGQPNVTYYIYYRF